MLARILTLLALSATVLVPAAQSAPLAAPASLRAFLLRSDEPITNSFPRTPSFAWTPYDTARSYDFELATSKTFDESTVVWSTATRTTPLQVPAVAIPLALPWMTGSPYALYAHVRARTAAGLTSWSAPFGFNMRWKAVPQSILPDIPGLVHWRPIEGATSYEVWFVDAGKIISTTTNVADEREYYSFHPDTTWAGIVQWRVRAVRKIYGSLPNGLPVVTFGPWSQTFVSANPQTSTRALSLSQTVSDAVSTATAPAAHSLTPAFAYGGDTATNGIAGRLFRVYVATDRQCVNIVFTGAVVGSPAYAPRTSGPLALPTSAALVSAAQTAYLSDGAQAGTFTADLQTVTATEQIGAPTGGGTTTPPTTTPTTTPTTPAPATAPAPAAAPATATAPAPETPTIPTDFGASGSLVDLWDSGWPTGRYYWTVVPVREVTSTGGGVQYVDAEIPQDACAAGREIEFGKSSQPVTTSLSAPYVSGLNQSGQFVTARTATPSFYRAALVAWEPALGAIGYEVQWSKTRYPWKPASPAPVYTAATSMLLEGLSPGLWYYRVRGIDPYLLGPIKQMSWSTPVRIRIATPRFLVQNGVTTRPVKK